MNISREILSPAYHNLPYLPPKLETNPEKDFDFIKNGILDSKIEYFDELTIRYLETPHEIEKVKFLRQQINLEIHSLLDSNFLINEQRRDELGLTFCFELEGKTIGTIRFVPMKYGLTLTESLLGETEYSNPILYENGWEVGRLVLDPNYRNEQDLLKKCLFSTLLYLYENTNIQEFFASCTHVLSRLYRRFGFSIIKKDVLLPRTEKNYTLIRGNACEIFKYLSVEKANEYLN